eukprot:TRINITY_DN2276_c0_g1_i1.p1 TRINITY_DN2276_c0_g1~~TRINITY_DN2276_c0_g1_i1.p1  ORF type:complete len:118 (+),score=7.51 TRINITY_DN2276_c0_g1_i1:82-435(+)
MTDIRKLSIEIYKKVSNDYVQTTPKKLKLIDVYLFYVALTGVIQLLYAIRVGSFPFNSFLSGFISTIGSFVLTVSLRMHLNPKNAEKERVPYRPERAIADWLFCNIIFHFTLFSFLG